tara:strand:+ start:180 stop:899 length:720 start_codon:yes stop_codon:yes gene_type:complete
MTQVRPTWPMMLPWKDGQGQNLSFKEIVRSRRFSVTYLLSVMFLYAMLGYGSRDCFTPSEAIICDFALWPSQLFEAPHLYILSLFTSIWFHNDPNHFLLILVVILLFFQTAEVRIGTRRALVALFGVQFLVAILMTLYLYAGTQLYPDDPWYLHGYSGRNYMGGSVGLFGVMGVLFAQIDKPVAGALFYAGFEYWNGFIYHGASLYVVTGHVIAFTMGFCLGLYWLRQEMTNPDAATLN